MSPLIFTSTEQPAKPACELKEIISELGFIVVAALFIYLFFR